MNRMLLSLSIVSLILAAQVHGHDSDGQHEERERGTRLQLADAEFDIRMHELQHVMSLHAVEEAKIEREKLKLHVDQLQTGGTTAELGIARLDLKKAEIRVRMHELQSEMEQLKVEKLKARLDLLRPPKKGKTEKATPVHLEYVDDLDVVIIRGQKKGVDKVRALIEAARKEKE